MPGNLVAVDPDNLPDPLSLPPHDNPDEYDIDGDDGQPWGESLSDG